MKHRRREVASLGDKVLPSSSTVDDIQEELDQIEDSPPTKTRKLRSKVWEHFDLIPRFEGVDGKKSQCKHCKKVVPCAPKGQGTSGMLAHIKRCSTLIKEQTTLDSYQKKLTYDASTAVGKVKGVMKLDTYDEKKVRRAIAVCIIEDELPFRFVERSGFIKLINLLEPRFKMVSRWTVARDCMRIYLSEMNILKTKLLEYNPRVCLTTDTWKSVQNITYMCVTTHFIDTQWRLQKRVLGFRRITDHKGKSLSKELEKLMLEWGLHKILTITVDNASNNDTCLDHLRHRQLKKFGERVGGVIGENQNLHMRCAAHILNLIVQDGLKEIDHSVQKMRQMVRYVKSSPQREDAFKKCVEAKGLDSKCFLQLDVCTRWNSTYSMLMSVEKHKAAFEEMLEMDDGYLVGYLLEVRDGSNAHVGVPTSYDWDHINKFIKFLKLFYKATLSFSASKTCTAHIFFTEVANIKMQLDTFMLSDDNSFALMARRMQVKFDKYWGEFTAEDPKLRLNRYLFVAIVLESKYKLGWFEYWFSLTLSDDTSKKAFSLVKQMVEDLFAEYSSLYGTSTTEEVGASASSSSSQLSNDFSAFLARKLQMDEHNELDRYLMERNEPLTASYDILDWWKLNETKYPILSRIVRDVLAVPITTVPSESVFSMGGRVLSVFRNSMAPKTAEGLICAQDWLKENTENLYHCDETEEQQGYLLDTELEERPQNILEGGDGDNYILI